MCVTSRDGRLGVFTGVGLMVGWLSSTVWWAASLLGFLWCFGLRLGWVKVLKGEQWVK